VLSALRAMGVQLAVDDFGTGYSSLTFLTRVTVDEVKIDRGFVRRMVESPEVAAIVRTTVDLAHRLGLRVIAEGVETAEQRAALTALGCTGAQGFFFYPPLPPERIVDVLRELTTATVVPLRQEDAS
jgi:EAL domain-containing protein (putative c-di-GMP-specific phosphodiesterase class I)